VGMEIYSSAAVAVALVSIALIRRRLFNVSSQREMNSGIRLSRSDLSREFSM
jgi:hypothetical protein